MKEIKNQTKSGYESQDRFQRFFEDFKRLFIKFRNSQENIPNSCLKPLSEDFSKNYEIFRISPKVFHVLPKHFHFFK